MLKLEITEIQVSSVFSDKKILKLFNKSTSCYNSQINNFVFDFYNHIRIHSEFLLSELHITKDDIWLVCLSSIKHDIINFAFKSIFIEKKYNIKRNIISVLKNEQIIEDFCTNTRHFEKCFYEFAVNNVEPYKKSIIQEEINDIPSF